MVILPIDKRLKRRVHRNLALSQDILVMEVYNIFPASVIHGGTAIWRCYGGNRFSEDADFYLPMAAKSRDMEAFLDSVKGKGFSVGKFRKTGNAIFAKFTYLGTEARLECVFRDMKDFTTRPFEMSDGNSMLVNTLKPEDLIGEKVSAYMGRKKARDLYDIFFLLRLAEDREKVKAYLRKLPMDLPKPPDERELKALIISGAVPSFEEMAGEVKRWAR